MFIIHHYLLFISFHPTSRYFSATRSDAASGPPARCSAELTCRGGSSRAAHQLVEDESHNDTTRSPHDTVTQEQLLHHQQLSHRCFCSHYLTTPRLRAVASAVA